jgi:ABC-2 type transport system permease protein
MGLVLLRLELRQVLRAGGVRLAVVAFVAAGIIGLAYGHTVIRRQQQTLAESESLQRAQHDRVLAPLPADARAGDQLYYLFFHTRHLPSPWAAVSLGQRDLQGHNLKIRLLALQGQLHDAEIANPMLQAMGHFDLAFVLVLVAPLLVILLCHDVWSAEREQGTWAILRSQSTSGGHVLLLKLVARTLVVLVPALALVLIAALVLGLAFDDRLLSVCALTTAYVVCWTAASALMASLRGPSDFNLAALIGLWVATTVLAPAAIQAVAATRHPLPEPMELAVRARDGYHAAWDLPVPDTMARFYEHYPEWQTAPVPRDTYSNAWYYAMQQRGDDAAAPAFEAYLDALDRRRQFTGGAARLFPPLVLQLALDEVARTGLGSQRGYLTSVAAFHEDLKRFFWPVVFSERTVREVEWARAPRHSYRDERPPDVAGSLWTMAVTLFVLSAAAWVGLRRALRAGHEAP